MTRKIILTIFITLFFWSYTSLEIVIASTTDGIIPANSYIWGENIGWINFGATNGNVHVTDTAATGYAWSSTYGWINLGPTNGGVTNNSEGQLGGNAWSANLGWIPFAGVTINSSGKFTGTAGTAGSTMGRINFDCANCSITTDWRPASVRGSTSSTSSSSSSSSSNSSSTGTTATATPIPSGFTVIDIDETSSNPTQLFDIALIIDDQLIEDSRKLKARVTFTSFGTEDTPVDMEFIVLDNVGKQLYRATAQTVIQTEGIYNQSFNNLVLPDGRYTLLLKTFYGDDVRDEFRQQFEVKSSQKIDWRLILIPLSLIALYLLAKKKPWRKVRK